MLRRLLLGLTEGLVVGVALGVVCSRGLGLTSPGNLVALLLGAVAGFAIGLVAGRPVWARDAKTEALLKASAGALVGVGLSFALRRWLSIELDLSAFSLGTGAAGKLSAVALPAVTTALALFFELDDDGTRGAATSPTTARGKRRVEADGTASELDDSETLADEVERKFEKR